MNPIPNTNVVDLIKVRTIRRKHVEQLIEPLNMELPADSWKGIEFLCYISALNAALARELETGHLRVIRANTYCYSLSRGTAEERANFQAARAFLESLPQLLLD